MSIFWNTLKNAIFASGLLITVGVPLLKYVATLFGCTFDDPATPVVEPSVCTGGAILSIPVWLQATVGGLALLAYGAIKGWAGSGTVMQNLFSPSAPVVKESVAGPGTVTKAQVDEP